jgi:hypothetical protein
MDIFVNSPVIPLTEAALSAVFLLVMFCRRNINYLYPALMLSLPAAVDAISLLVPKPAEYPVYYFSLSAISIIMMMKMFDFKHEFTAKFFFVLTLVCVILAAMTTHVQLSDDGSDATMLGFIFVMCWWAMDCLVIWMAINGKFNRVQSVAGK